VAIMTAVALVVLVRQDAVMSRQYLLLAGITIVLVPIGVYAYAWSQQDDTSPLESYLGSNGFVPITPPSTFVTLGSLYYLDGESHLLNEICGVGSEDIDKEKLNAWIQHSPGETGSGINISGSKFVIQLDLGASGVGAQEQNSTRRQVSYTLTDVSFDKISMEHDRAVADVLMKKDNCRSSVTRVWEAGGYVCQGRLIVTASAKYDLTRLQQFAVACVV